MSGRSIAIPGAIRLEASTACQLACPVCPTTLGTIKERLGTGFLRFEAFRDLIDANPSLWRIELSNWGEIFLNPDIGRIIEYAYRRNVALTAWNGANLNHVREPVLEALARYRFRGITCSIDGVTQETYAAYRVDGDLDRVLANVRKLNDHKRRWKTQYPWLSWQMIAFRHNAHEVEAARALARELGMGFLLKQGVDPNLPRPGGTATPAAPAEPSPEAPDPARQVARDLTMDYCAQLWDEPQINFDGRLLGCCVNTTWTFGPNVFEVGLSNALADAKMEHAKRMLQGDAPARADVPCTGCHVYEKRATAGVWVDRTPRSGLVASLRRRGHGRAIVWMQNRFERAIVTTRGHL